MVELTCCSYGKKVLIGQTRLQLEAYVMPKEKK